MVKIKFCYDQDRNVLRVHVGLVATDPAEVTSILSFVHAIYHSDLANYLLKFYCQDVGKLIVFDPSYRMSCTLCSSFLGETHNTSFPTKFRPLKTQEQKDDLQAFNAFEARDT